jgi:hypothetical protein
MATVKGTQNFPGVLSEVFSQTHGTGFADRRIFTIPEIGKLESTMIPDATLTKPPARQSVPQRVEFSTPCKMSRASAGFSPVIFSIDNHTPGNGKGEVKRGIYNVFTLDLEKNDVAPKPFLGYIYNTAGVAGVTIPCRQDGSLDAGGHARLTCQAGRVTKQNPVKGRFCHF